KVIDQSFSQKLSGLLFDFLIKISSFISFQRLKFGCKHAIRRLYRLLLFQKISVFYIFLQGIKIRIEKVQRVGFSFGFLFICYSVSNYIHSIVFYFMLKSQISTAAFADTKP